MHAAADAQGKKTLGVHGILKLLKTNKFTCATESDCRKLFKEIDRNKDGIVDLKDFQEVNPKP